MSKWLLILTLFGGGEFETIPFQSEELCELAGRRWLAASGRGETTNGMGNPIISWVCVRQAS